MSNLAKWGDIERLLPQRIIKKIRLIPGPLLDYCWEWTGYRDPDGYGKVGKDGHDRKASRVVYEALCGPIPETLELDHLCRNRSCVNPLHLEPVTHLVNVARGNAGQYLKQRTHCSKGHPYNANNTIYYANGKRGCHICRLRWSRECRERQQRQREMQRGGVFPVNSRSKTHCLRGHEYNTENTYWGRNGRRHCRICRRDQARERRSRSGLHA